MNKYEELLRLANVSFSYFNLSTKFLRWTIPTNESISLETLSKVQALTNGELSIHHIYDHFDEQESVDVEILNCSDEFVNEYLDYSSAIEEKRIEERRKQRELEKLQRKNQQVQKNELVKRQKEINAHGGRKGYEKFLIEQEIKRRKENGIEQGSFIDSPDHINPWMP